MVSKDEMIRRGKEKYELSIRQLGGADAYFTCGDKGGMEVAICLKGLKKGLSESAWADRWAQAMA